MAENIHKGLEGIAVAETRLSDIDGQKGELIIGGYPLDEIAGNATFEESVFLLWNDRLPTPTELDEFSSRLASYREIPDATMDIVRAAAESQSSAMDALRMGAASVNLDGDDDERRENGLRLIARLPTITAAYHRMSNGLEPVAPDESLSHAGNYLYMLKDEQPTDAQVRGLETYLNTVIDHGLNASTFTGRVIVSTESDIVSAVTGSIGALKGPLHGGAPGPVLDMLLELDETDDKEAHIQDTLESGNRLMGFGHRVYKTRDPRAEVLSTAAEQFYQSDGDMEFFHTATEVEDMAVDLLKEFKPDLSLETNVEYYTALLLYGVGIPKDLFTATFTIARAGGWTAHSLEQYDDNRLIRPTAVYNGARDRTWVPLDQRPD